MPVDPLRAWDIGVSVNGAKARDVLVADTRRILLAGPDGMTTLASSHLLLAASSAADWV